MAESNSSVTVNRQATFTKEEAEYLRALLQNPLMGEESESDYEMRKNLFTCFDTLTNQDTAQ